MTDTNDIVWKLEQDVETNEAYKTIKANLQNVIKQCHDLLYSRASIVGMKAQNDIMRVLCLIIFRPYFQDENSPLWKKYLEVKETNPMIERYIEYCKDLSLITREERVDIKWSLLVKHCLVHLLPSIYSSSDEKFNCEDVNTLTTVISKLSAIQIDNDFIDAFATSCGDVHEAFRAYGGGKGAKEFGQYFTPRHLIHLIFHGLGLRELVSAMEDASVYDCCLGAGGFVTRMYTLADVKPENVYGCEIENDTIKFGEAAVVLTTKSTESNIVRCNSLCENPFLFTKKMDVIATNPPFGTKMDYNDLEKKFNEFAKTHFPTSTIKFKDIYPVKTNNGACLFVQHCVYMLEEGGICAIVLPDGELFDGNGKWPKAFRKWWCQTVNILKILKVPSGAFEHAGVKTNVVVFMKNGPTQNIQFLQTNKECTNVTDTFTVNEQNLVDKEYKLSVEVYKNESQVNYTVTSEKLGSVCAFKSGRPISKQNLIGTLYPYYGCNGINGYVDEFLYDGSYIICAQDGSIGSVEKVNGKFYCSNHTHVLTSLNNEKVDNTYIYYFLKYGMDWNSITKGMIPKVTQEALKNKDIPLPCLEIQHEIVQELSSLEDSINTVKTRIEQLEREKELYFKHGRKAEIRELLKDCEEKPLGDVCHIVNGSQLDKAKIVCGQYPVFGGGKQLVGYHDNYNRNGGEVIVCGTGAHCGYVSTISTPFWASQCFTIMSNSEHLMQEYVYYVCKLEKQNIFKASAKGAGQPYIRGSQFLNLPIHVPSQDTQQQCINIFKEKETYLNSIQDKIEKEQQYLTELKQLGKDIISSYCG